jgi:hypothetical protein
MRLRAASVVTIFLVAAANAPVSGFEPDPLSVLEKLIAAEHSIDVAAALALFADDAVIVNVTGRKFSGQELKSFVEEAIWRGDGFVIESPHAQDNTAAWTEEVTAKFYESIGVAPVTFAFRAVFQKGKSSASFPTFLRQR